MCNRKTSDEAFRMISFLTFLLLISYPSKCTVFGLTCTDKICPYFGNISANKNCQAIKVQDKN